MKKRQYISIFAFLAALLLAVQVQATTIYTTYGDFLADFPGPTVENFEDTTLQPGLSVVSTYSGAVIEDGVYKDIIGGTSNYTTTWTHSNGFLAWGGFFDLAGPGGEGTSILVTVVDSGEVIGEIDSSFNGGFWGFTTGSAFDQVILSEGTSSGAKETYWNVDLQYATAPVPEPGTMILFGIGLLGLAGFTRRKI